MSPELPDFEMKPEVLRAGMFSLKVRDVGKWMSRFPYIFKLLK